jgi:glycosyltransferase involved in cell wall biosynthesis
MTNPASSFQLPASRPVLGVITSQFPELHETFVVRELAALKEAGVPLRVYSLKRCRDRIVHADAQPLIGLTTYAAWDSPRTWLTAAAMLVRHPLRAASALAWVLRRHGWPPSTLAKALVVWVQSMALARRMRSDGITHVHAHWATMPATAAVLISRWLGTSFSFTAHAWDVFVGNPSLREKIRLASRVITCTEYNRQYLARLCPAEHEKIVLNYHGVDVEQFERSGTLEARSWKLEAGKSPEHFPASSLQHPASNITPLFLSIGRLVPTKGYAALIDAYRLLKEKGVAFRAVVVGQGPLRRALERRIRRAGLEDQVELRPAMSQEELHGLYARACAFVLPSEIAGNGDRDGIPNVILEAMAMGLPVVSTTVSGIPEAVQDRRTGLLVEPGDAKAVAHAMEILLRRPKLARIMGDQGRMWAETQFADRDHMARLIRQFEELLEGAGGGRRRAGEDKDNPRPTPHAPRPTKVMCVIWSLEIGGAERIVVSLAGGLDRERFSPMVVCLNHRGRLAQELERSGIPVVALHKRPGIDPAMCWRLYRLMRRERPGIVHTHLFGANLWGRLAARLSGVPVIIAHEHGMQPWRGRMHFLADRCLLPLTHRVLFASQEIMRGYAARTGANGACLHVPNGVPARGRAPDRRSARQRLGWAEGERIILSVGRLSPEKGHEDLVRAFALAAGRLPRTALVLVGEGPQRPALEALSARHGLTGRVVLAGPQEDVSAWLAGADVYVQPSRREAFSLSVLEAMASGVPVILTDVGDLAPLVSKERLGRVVPAGNPAALADTLVDVLAHSDQDAPLLQAAREFVCTRYSNERMLRRIEEIYTEALAGRRCR